MFGLDPVLSGSLCFLVLAVVMYIKFIKEQPLHSTADGSGTGDPEDDDVVPFLLPSVVKENKKNEPPSPLFYPRYGGGRAMASGVASSGMPHHYSARQQYKKIPPTRPYNQYMQAKQPMRRRAHSAAANPNAAMNAPVLNSPPAMTVDTSLGISSSVDPRPAFPIAETTGFVGEGLQLQLQQEPASTSTTSFGGSSDTTHTDKTNSLGRLEDGHYTASFGSLEAGLGLGLGLGVGVGVGGDASCVAHHAQSHDATPPPVPFMMGGGNQHVTMDPDDTKRSPKVATERPFRKESVPQPAQMQLEVARKARIPLFLHSPMYVRVSASPLKELQPALRDHDALKQLEKLKRSPRGAGAGACAGAVGDPLANATPRRQQKLPAKCKNNSLHIDFADLKIQEAIGQGAFGSVHRAIWRGVAVAVKILVCQQLTPDVLEEFETEVQIMSILRHPNICLLMGACLDPPTRCLVIEYLPRGSLWNVLRQDIVIDFAKQVSFARDTALGMNYLHSFQPPILHRDLKSPNLLVDTSYAIKISDFGLARVRAHFQTMTGNCGTTQWMAPEVLGAEKYTEKADVFSYGIVCWELVTRACPYDGIGQIQAALGVLSNNLRPTIPADCPPLFRKLMTLCWVNAPDQRPTFEAILELLNEAQEELAR